MSAGQVEDVEVEEEVPKVPLHRAKEQDDVKRSNVFCCSIVHHQRHNVRRYRRSTRFLRILEANMKPGDPIPSGPQWPRPLTSPAPCFNCHRHFTRPPVFLPMRMLDGVAEEDMNFCCGPCANTYLHTNMRDAFLAGRAADLLEYMQRVHGFQGAQLGFAPHFSELQRYLGDLTDEQFDEICGRPELTTATLRRPFIPTDVVVEWQCVGTGGPLTSASVAPEGVGAAAPPGVAAAPEPPRAHGGQMPGPALQAAITKPIAPAEVAGAILASAMRAPAPPTDNQQRWDVSFLQQPPHEDILKRCANLPEPPRGESLYAKFCAELDAAKANAAAAAASAGGVIPGATPAAATAGAAAASAPVTDFGPSAAARGAAPSEPRKDTVPRDTGAAASGSCKGDPAGAASGATAGTSAEPVQVKAEGSRKRARPAKTSASAAAAATVSGAETPLVKTAPGNDTAAAAVVPAAPGPPPVAPPRRSHKKQIRPAPAAAPAAAPNPQPQDGPA